MSLPTMGVLHEGRVWFREGLKYGFLDENGDIVIPARYDEASDFHQGRAIAKLGSLYGFVDPSGHEVIPRQFIHAGTFAPGRALVMRVDRQAWFIDHAGTLLVRACAFDECSYYFTAGRARIGRGGAWGFLDLDGNEAVPCIYEDVSFYFREDRARVKRAGLWGFVSSSGEEVIPCRYGYAEDFGSGGSGPPHAPGVGPHARVSLASGLGLIDVYGREVVPCRYVDVSPPREARARVDRGPMRDGEETFGGVGFVDLEGVEVIPCVYESATDFEGGRAKVTKKGDDGAFRTFYVDTSGRELPAVP